MAATAWDGRSCQWPALLCDSQQSVHHFIRGRQDEQLDSCWDPGDASVSSVSVAVWLVCLLLSRQATNGHYFQIKSPPLRTQFLTPMGCNVKLLFWRQNRPASRHVTCLRQPQWQPSGGFVEKKEYYSSLLDRQGGRMQPLSCCKCAAFSILKRLVRLFIAGIYMRLWWSDLLQRPLMSSCCKWK